MEQCEGHALKREGVQRKKVLDPEQTEDQYLSNYPERPPCLTI